MKETTLCLLVEGDPPRRVLLGRKKEGFGAGKYTGFGGKVEAGETPAGAALRELEEETGVRVQGRDLQHAGTLTFEFPSRPAWSQRVHVYRATKWSGEPVESREMEPIWYPVDAPPYDLMWQDGAHWLPPILAGQRIRAHFTFCQDNETVDRVTIRAWDEGEQPEAGEG